MQGPWDWKELSASGAWKKDGGVGVQQESKAKP